MNQKQAFRLEFSDLKTNIEFYNAGNYKGLSAERLEELYAILNMKKSEVEDEWYHSYNTALREIKQEREDILLRRNEIITLSLEPKYTHSGREYDAFCYGSGDYYPKNTWHRMGVLENFNIYESKSKAYSIKVTPSNLEYNHRGNIIICDTVYYDDDGIEKGKLKYLEIQDIRIDPAFIGMGHGNDLFEIAENVAVQNNCDLITCDLLSLKDEETLLENVRQKGYLQSSIALFKCFTDQGSQFIQDRILSLHFKQKEFLKNP